MTQEFINEFLLIFLRAFASIAILYILTRIMGKKQIAQLTYFDYVAGISIGSATANFALNQQVTPIQGLTVLILWALVPLIMALLTRKSISARRILDGVPSIIIQNGKILEENVKKAKLNINNILEQLRDKGAFNIADVEFAVMETNGKLSVLKKADKLPISPVDMNIPTQYKGLCANLIVDGKIMYDHLDMINKDELWLENQLRKINISHHKQVLLASYDTTGKLYVDLKGKNEVPYKILD